MPLTLLDKVIIKIFNDYEDGELPDDLEEWFDKYIPNKKRKKIPEKLRCIANTYTKERCSKRVFNKSCFCHQHMVKFDKDKKLQYGIYKEKTIKKNDN